MKTHTLNRPITHNRPSIKNPISEYYADAFEEYASIEQAEQSALEKALMPMIHTVIKLLQGGLYFLAIPYFIWVMVS